MVAINEPVLGEVLPEEDTKISFCPILGLPLIMERRVRTSPGFHVMSEEAGQKALKVGQYEAYGDIYKCESLEPLHGDDTVYICQEDKKAFLTEASRDYHRFVHFELEQKRTERQRLQDRNEQRKRLRAAEKERQAEESAEKRRLDEQKRQEKKRHLAQAQQQQQHKSLYAQQQQQQQQQQHNLHAEPILVSPVEVSRRGLPCSSAEPMLVSPVGTVPRATPSYGSSQEPAYASTYPASHASLPHVMVNPSVVVNDPTMHAPRSADPRMAHIVDVTPEPYYGSLNASHTPGSLNSEPPVVMAMPVSVENAPPPPPPPALTRRPPPPPPAHVRAAAAAAAASLGAHTTASGAGADDRQVPMMGGMGVISADGRDPRARAALPQGSAAAARNPHSVSPGRGMGELDDLLPGSGGKDARPTAPISAPAQNRQANTAITDQITTIMDCKDFDDEFI